MNKPKITKGMADEMNGAVMTTMKHSPDGTMHVMTERERMFMKDKKGMPLNKAIKGMEPKKYGALGQH